MIINEILSITASKGAFVIEYKTFKACIDKTSDQYTKIAKFYVSAKQIAPEDRANCVHLDDIQDFLDTIEKGVLEISPIKALQKLIDFFSEFSFEPNFRFVNSLTLSMNDKKTTCGLDYITNYFSLIDSPFKREVVEKMKSPEFKFLLESLSKTKPTKTINNRFKVYYGSQGTGKTTKAMKETGGRCMVCNSSMLPSDLMEDFVFVDGKATFQPSALWNAMAEGTKITLDEINLLPFDSLRFLQTILDGKKEFLYKGHKVEITDGFQIIGTMNLCVNGMTYGLPEPLVDRASEMKKFSLTAENLLEALI